MSEKERYTKWNIFLIFLIISWLIAPSYLVILGPIWVPNRSALAITGSVEKVPHQSPTSKISSRNLETDGEHFGLMFSHASVEAILDRVCVFQFSPKQSI